VSRLPQEFAEYLKSKGLSKSSIRNYSADLAKFIRWFEVITGEEFDPKKIPQNYLDKFQEYLRENNQPDNSIRRNLATLKQFLNWANPHINILSTTTPEAEILTPDATNISTPDKLLSDIKFYVFSDPVIGVDVSFVLDIFASGIITITATRESKM